MLKEISKIILFYWCYQPWMCIVYITAEMISWLIVWKKTTATCFDNQLILSNLFRQKCQIFIFSPPAFVPSFLRRLWLCFILHDYGEKTREGQLTFRLQWMTRIHHKPTMMRRKCEAVSSCDVQSTQWNLCIFSGPSCWGQMTNYKHHMLENDAD